MSATVGARLGIQVGTILGSIVITAADHTTGAVLTGAGTIHGVMAIMQDGTIPGLIPGSTRGIMAMQAGMVVPGMDGVVIILGIGEVRLWLTCAQATAIVALAIQHQALT